MRQKFATVVEVTLLPESVTPRQVRRPRVAARYPNHRKDRAQHGILLSVRLRRPIGRYWPPVNSRANRSRPGSSVKIARHPPPSFARRHSRHVSLEEFNPHSLKRRLNTSILCSLCTVGKRIVPWCRFCRWFPRGLIERDLVLYAGMRGCSRVG